MKTVLERDGAERISERLLLYRAPHPRQVATFADDVRSGLCAPTKHLPPKYLYDALGSALFEAICQLPEYYLTRAESEILARDAGAILDAVGAPLEIVELGSGSAQKTRVLIEEALRRQELLTYRPIDISASALVGSAGSLIASYEQLIVTAYASDYFDVLLDGGLGRAPGSRVLALFLGSNIGNYDPPRARMLLRALAQALRPGDCLLLGADLKKDVRVLELAYDDPTGVTAAFNKNLLGRINRELGGTFDLRAFAHTARYQPLSGSVDSFLIASHAHDVRVEGLSLTVRFEHGEPIHTESSHKFSPEDIEELGKITGFAVTRQWRDAAERFGLWLLRVV
ncbi:MAG: L-histidine N(alpha)-methyltransferase [Candidatus Eremiobacteraeota bacterium]|nr:L-histidine N(alpha)-methyltransferase [Candidatus Eremiobacteraeota bacterium]